MTVIPSLVIGIASSAAERRQLAQLLAGTETFLIVSSAHQARRFLDLVRRPPVTPVPVAPSVDTEPPPEPMTMPPPVVPVADAQSPAGLLAVPVPVVPVAAAESPAGPLAVPPPVVPVADAQSPAGPVPVPVVDVESLVGLLAVPLPVVPAVDVESPAGPLAVPGSVVLPVDVESGAMPASVVPPGGLRFDRSGGVDSVRSGGVGSPAGVAVELRVGSAALELAVDSDRRVLRWREREVGLTPLEHDLLVCLTGTPGQVWTYARLHRAVWGTDHLGRRSDMHSVVRRLRRKLCRLDAPATIHAVRAVGFRLTPS
ncbi:winged helix-turn-helix domain-containing protein [Micromonospora sp. NBS 11-29]|uniref:winged helix-turn-helix domain-containing protein n=1 Tax=Micromonospora sp. NBS 11-29 TaxID=1960879 RepID=UPI0020CDF2F9|nr:winged helix-turn-helix domain-containing protein [Micromonospora sp. NBS 11-29]